MSNVEGLVLALPAKPDVERDAVADRWEAGGGEILRLDRFWQPPAVDAQRVRLYGPDTFALVVAQVLGLELVGPPHDLLVALPMSATLRDVAVMPLGSVEQRHLPAHIKPVVPKAFAAAVTHDLTALRERTTGLDAATPVLVSEVIELMNEVRCFVVDGVVLAEGTYEGEARRGAADFVGSLLAETGFTWPAAMDVGWTDRGWAVIEANDAWGAGLNGCDAWAVLPAIAAATRLPQQSPGDDE